MIMIDFFLAIFKDCDYLLESNSNSRKTFSILGNNNHGLTHSIAWLRNQEFVPVHSV